MGEEVGEAGAGGDGVRRSIFAIILFRPIFMSHYCVVRSRKVYLTRSPDLCLSVACFISLK